LSNSFLGLRVVKNSHFWYNAGMFFVETASAQGTNMIQQANEGIGVVDISWKFLVFIGIFIIFFIVGKIIKVIVSNRIAKKPQYQGRTEFIILVERLVMILIIAFGILVGLEMIDIDIAWMFGAFSVGLGLAFRGTFENIIASFVILSQHKFKIGDLVKINEEIGKISKIDMRTTDIETFHGSKIIVPNVDMVSNFVENLYAQPHRRLDFNVGVHYKSDLDQVIKITELVLQADPDILETPKSAVIVSGIGSSNIEIAVRFWVSTECDIFLAKSRIIQRVLKAYSENNITIAYQTMTMSPDPYERNISIALQNTATTKPISNTNTEFSHLKRNT